MEPGILLVMMGAYAQVFQRASSTRRPNVFYAITIDSSSAMFWNEIIFYRLVTILWRFTMFRKLTLGACVFLMATSAFAANKEQERLENSGTVLEEVMNIPDDIPQDLIDKAECVIVFPSVLKAAFIVGGSYGRGAMVCRTGEHFSGPWGAPAMYALEGGSVGFQLGGEATDLVLLVMNHRGATSILDSKVKLGADASAAAGPKGRDASADTDAYLRAEILSYSRARGLFAGISLAGSTLRPDDDASADVYGRKITARQIIMGGEAAVPPSGQHLVRVLQKFSPRNDSQKSSD
jgi:lipid-binding SYLF domain-containing protein